MTTDAEKVRLVAEAILDHERWIRMTRDSRGEVTVARHADIPVSHVRKTLTAILDREPTDAEVAMVMEQ